VSCKARPVPIHCARAEESEYENEIAARLSQASTWARSSRRSPGPMAVLQGLNEFRFVGTRAETSSPLDQHRFVCEARGPIFFAPGKAADECQSVLGAVISEISAVRITFSMGQPQKLAFARTHAC